MNQDLIEVIELEIERMETLLDDFSEFTKGCTDAEQKVMNEAAGIIQDYIKIEGQKLMKAEAEKD